MWLSGKIQRMPSPEEALPGRKEEMVVPEKHYVMGQVLRPPFPREWKPPYLGWVVFGELSGVTGKLTECSAPLWVMPGDTHPTRPMKRFAAASQVTMRWCGWYLIPLRSATRSYSRCSGSHTILLRECARKRSGHPVPLGNLCWQRGTTAAGGTIQGPLPGCAI